MSAAGSAVLVGLLGLHTTSSRVATVTASAIAARSWRSSASRSTVTAVAPDAAARCG
jgi:hypothetical protein